jgi:hypothetical protein
MDIYNGKNLVYREKKIKKRTGRKYKKDARPDRNIKFISEKSIRDDIIYRGIARENSGARETNRNDGRANKEVRGYNSERQSQ